jgi:IS1 family transposase
MPVPTPLSLYDYNQPYKPDSPFRAPELLCCNLQHKPLTITTWSSILASMKRLNSELRGKVLHSLMEGMSIRATARLFGVSKTTILKLVEDAGRAAVWYQDRVFQNLNSRRLQVDEIWGFCGSKAANTPADKKATGEAGDVWVWICTDADTKLVPSWLVGNREAECAVAFLADIKERLTHKVQLSSDGHRSYLDAVEDVFGDDVDYAQIIKIFAPSKTVVGRYSPPACIGARKDRMIGSPDPKHVSTSYSERNNLNVRMHSRRMTRLTNAFSKKIENHTHAMALHFLYYNFVRVHQTLKVTPAMAAGVTKRLWEMKDVVDMLEAWEATQERVA